MASKKSNFQELDFIFGRMMETMNQSKKDIFIISEQSRQSYEELHVELEKIRTDISRAIAEGDVLEEKAQVSRRRLAEVSRDNSIYTETEVRKVYEQANDLQIQLSVNRSEEKQLRQKRDELEQRLQHLLRTIERAELFVNQVNFVINYMTSNQKSDRTELENTQLKQDYSLRIIEAQEEERKRVSREIHDGPAQMMANVLLRSDLIERTYREKGAAQAFQEITSLKEMVRDALTEVRRIIYDLRPMALDDLGLVPTLKKYLATIEDYNPGCRISFQSEGRERRLPAEREVPVFRMVQEAVSNAVRHGKASEIQVTAEWEKNKVTFIVKDNGTGFDPNAVKQQSYGLIGMRERVDLIDGKMFINSAPGAGTVLMFQIPTDK
ncbi:sensor histidine kinase [Planococcus lenghuensis]|uniref:Signal transduction histidine-protein kinase/phosphatase DegS n=1 Tax=Planococcus lenghuensis TaxID=2213202 RepID=A0A1Q2L0L1_9BACL|nr:sensor histidine kinase [Planococcus lenghuensis]AQQ53953.1 histidine kinase [Planococcus lenghuensis]